MSEYWVSIFEGSSFGDNTAPFTRFRGTWHHMLWSIQPTALLALCENKKLGTMPETHSAIHADVSSAKSCQISQKWQYPWKWLLENITPVLLIVSCFNCFSNAYICILGVHMCINRQKIYDGRHHQQLPYVTLLSISVQSRDQTRLFHGRISDNVKKFQYSKHILCKAITK